MKEKISIVLADDHTLLRDALAETLAAEQKFEISGKVSNGKELLAFLKKDKADIVLLDIEMPIMKGTEALKLISERHPEVRVIMLSYYTNIAFISEAVKLGARGYLHKSCSMEELYHCVTQVFEKGFFLEEKKANELLEFSRAQRPNHFDRELTERETEIVKELCTGSSEKDIAQKLNISHNTVHKHRENIYRKTNSHNLAQVIFYALKKGILDFIT